MLINGFVLLLCSLLTIASRMLRQAGSSNLEINGQTKQVDCGQTLLNSMAQQEIFLPAACGGKGTCGRCEVKVEQGGGDPTSLETLQLGPARIAALSRLACQVKVRGDLRVLIPEALMAARSFRVNLQTARMVGENIRIMTFALQDGQEISFQAGQYLQVVFNQPWERVLRAYSLSSPPSEKKWFSLDIQLVEGGLVSSYLHSLEPGDSIMVTGPFGDMALQPGHLEIPVVLIAGGVGLAPIRSIVARFQQDGFRNPVMLFHGARSRAGLYCEDEFRSLARSFSGFRYFPALSQPMLEDGWTGERGMIHQVLEKHLGSVTVGTSAFICGPKPMMQAVTKVLVAKGLPSDRILTDPFDF